VASRPSIPEWIGKRLRALVNELSALQGKLSSRARRVILVVLAAALLLSPGIFEEFTPAGEVLGGVRVAGIDASRLSARELEETIGKRARALEQRPLALRVPQRVAQAPFSLEPKAIHFRVDVTKTVERVLAVGRAGNVFVRVAGVYARWFAPARVELAVTVDASELSKVLARFGESAIADRAFGGGIVIEGAKVEAQKPRGGRQLDLPGAERVVRRALVADEAGVVELPVVRIDATLPADAADGAARAARALVAGPITLVSSDPPARVELSPNELGTVLATVVRPPRIELIFVPERLETVLEKARKAIELEAVDAKIEVDGKGTLRVVPSRAGLRIDLAKMGEALSQAADKPERTGALPLLFEPRPALATEEVEKLGISGLVSSFTTRHPCCEKRVANIHRIADIMNGRVVRPGETVSVNAIVGPRTAKNGFVPAPTIEEGEMVDSPGGGISQFATTFFNALFHGGYEIVERQPHSYWFPRYPMGHEATLSWPKPDIIFKNDTAAGMAFVTSYTSTSITVKIYGDNAGRKVRAQVSGRQNVVEPAVEILANADVPPDEEKVKEPGSVGWSVVVSRFVTFPDGTTREDRRRVTYKPRPKRVEVHPCRIPRGEKGYTGERCPEPEDVEELPAAP
jgi:vancomycin resistance protein YoaR